MIVKETVTAAQAGMRLDDGAALLFAALSKTRVRRIVDLGGCTVNGAMVRVASRTLRQGDEIVRGGDGAGTVPGACLYRRDGSL